ncbi:flagellar hook-basal body complex protein FliE [Stenotrophobium rhamnosiphilum]|uniref:Flagellar hook-basal body complex protein FliE n=1 Tax=Stenotrophobium rhamnosiphilum TaxID=2029166 RepID=A0A2T5MDD6_9GAMM|nr:flagellar hook-basal body complex protein FliE [Stenotrophobium rhamnosiphilum]PTU30582.1 flagellar hook-basal body complex protein FliE [Stenotrophobium rhamnosiphilum]
MNDIDVNRVLSQIRSLSEQAANRPANVAAKSPTESGFGQLVGNAISQVNQTQQTATQLQQSFEMGDPSADLAKVMIAQASAQVSFKAMAEVRNRLVSAYQDIMNMPI